MASVTVFPQGRIEDEYLKNLCALFDKIHIGMPWLMEPTPTMIRLSGHGVLTMNRPRQQFSSHAELRNVLREYRNWITYSGHAGISSFLNGTPLQGEQERRWEISELLKQMNKGSTSPNSKELLYPLLLLHLYQDLAEKKKAAEEVLPSIETAEYALSEALGEGKNHPAPAPLFLSKAMTIPLQEETLEEILEAWLFLFGFLVTSTQMVLTTNPYFFDLILRKFEEGYNKDLISAKSLRIVNITLPSIHDMPWDKLLKSHQDNIRREMTNLVSVLGEGKDSIGGSAIENSVEAITKKLRGDYRTKSKDRMFQFRVANIKVPVPNLAKHPLFEVFFGKLVALLEL